MGKSRGYNCWTPEEEDALRNGVAKHGLGAWEIVRKDPDFSILAHRSGVQLKDKFRNLVKFRHVSLAEAQALKPKGSGPWSRKLSASGLTRASSLGRAVSNANSQDPNSPSNSQAGATESQDKEDVEEKPAEPSVSLFGGLALAAATMDDPVSSALAPDHAKIEEGLTLEEPKPEYKHEEDGVADAQTLETLLAPWSSSQRRKRRLHEDRRFGIYDQRRYSGKGGSGVPPGVAPLRRRGSRSGGKSSRSRGRSEFSDGFDDEELDDEDEDAELPDEDEDDEDEMKMEGASGTRSVRQSDAAGHRPSRHSSRSRAALRAFWRRAAAGDPIEDEAAARAEADGGDGDGGLVHCLCGVTYDDGAPMVECERCQVWSHIGCLKLASTSDTSHCSYDLKNYICERCQQQLAGLGGLSSTGGVDDPGAAALGRFLDNYLQQQGLVQNSDAGGAGATNGHHHPADAGGLLEAGPLSLGGLYGGDSFELGATDPGALLIGLANGNGGVGQAGSPLAAGSRSAAKSKKARLGELAPDIDQELAAAGRGEVGARGSGKPPAKRGKAQASSKKGTKEDGSMLANGKCPAPRPSPTEAKEDQLSLFLTSGPSSRQMEREKELQQLLSHSRHMHKQVGAAASRSISPHSAALAAAVRLRPDVHRPQPKALSAPRPRHHPEMQRRTSALSLTQLAAAAGGSAGSSGAKDGAVANGGGRVSPALINSLLNCVSSAGSPRQALGNAREASFTPSLLGGNSNASHPLLRAGSTQPGAAGPHGDLGALFGESDDDNASILSGTLLDRLSADHLLMGLLGGSRATTPASNVFLDNFLRGTPDLHLANAIASPGVDTASQLHFLHSLSNSAAQQQQQASAAAAADQGQHRVEGSKPPLGPPLSLDKDGKDDVAASRASSALPWKINSNNVYANLMQGILSSSPDPNMMRPKSGSPADYLDHPPRPSSSGFKPVAPTCSGLSKDDLCKIDSLVEGHMGMQRELSQLMAGGSSGALSLLEGLRSGTPDPWAALLRTGTPGPTAEMLALHGFAMPPLGGDFSAAPWLLGRNSTPPLGGLEIAASPALLNPQSKKSPKTTDTQPGSGKGEEAGEAGGKGKEGSAEDH